MTITEETTITEIARAIPSSIRVFQRNGIDFCCGGRKSLGAACQDRGLSFGAIADEIRSSADRPAGGGQDWSRAPLSRLIGHIVETYHAALRRDLPRLESMAAKAARVHGGKAPHLKRLDALVAELSTDLYSHMGKEENVLFPAINAIAAASRPAIAVGAPIRVLEHEHDRAGALLAEIRQITGGYDLPDWACDTVRALYHDLSELEAAMHVHVHLENNVLFPRALALTNEPARL